MAARRRVAYAAVMHAGPPDLPDLAPLPPDIRAVVERQMAALAAERAARLHLESENEELKAHNTRLQHLVRELERARYGRRSEKLDPDQLELSLEDIEVGVGEAREAEEARGAARRGQN
jgi:transposase